MLAEQCSGRRRHDELLLQLVVPLLPSINYWVLLGTWTRNHRHSHSGTGPPIELQSPVNVSDIFMAVGKTFFGSQIDLSLAYVESFLSNKKLFSSFMTKDIVFQSRRRPRPMHPEYWPCVFTSRPLIGCNVAINVVHLFKCSQIFSHDPFIPHPLETDKNSGAANN